eukprot:gb/GFBE01064470.1/.p1 GENE.gb/GFBE01064470.1/~~gb/GFBE01064470.1/.p1  ORF type:complete len:320 (+),score=56.29 gb/GFBE01064470.1/:1-960(+)
MSSSSSAGAAGDGSHGADGGVGGVQTLSEGIAAVMSAMSSEVSFTNENEVAFAQLRRGCFHCAGRSPEASEALRQVPREQQAAIVAFLARRSQLRPSAARRVQELGLILAKSSPAWSELLAASAELGGPQGLLAAGLQVVHSRRAGGGPRRVPEELARPAPSPGHEARVFLRERRSQWYLSVAKVNNAACCIMTERAASLFICHWLGRGPSLVEGMQGFLEVSEDAEQSTEAKPRLDSPDLGFAHEGEPALGCFLGSRRNWGDVELCCTSRKFSKRECFRWGADASLQHRHSGLWLWVDKNEVTLSGEEKSTWEVLPAI